MWQSRPRHHLSLRAQRGYLANGTQPTATAPMIPTPRRPVNKTRNASVIQIGRFETQAWARLETHPGQINSFKRLDQGRFCRSFANSSVVFSMPHASK